MDISKQLARHIREIHFGKNWTWSDMQEALKDVTWEEATNQSLSCNTIALLVFHMNFYLKIVQERILGREVKFRQEDSFAAPAISSEADWQQLLQKTWDDAEAFAQIVEQLPESRLYEDISPKHGNFFKNIQGVVEHNHYHLGQIVLIKKMLRRA
jgi:DinB superfamily